MYRLDIIHLLHDYEENMKIYSPMENHNSREQHPRINLYIFRSFMQSIVYFIERQVRI